MTKKVKKLVVPAGGLGTRFLPITSVLPKEMFPLIDKPIIHYVLEEALVNGIEELILAISKDKQLLLDYITNTKDENLKKILKNIKVSVAYKNDFIGNAAGILDAKKYIGNDPFVIVWADSFGLRKDNRIGKMIKLYKKMHQPIICLFPFFDRARYLYAVPEVEQISKDVVKVKRIFEKPGDKGPVSPYCFGNGYLLESDIIEYIEKSTRNSKGEFVLEDAVDAYCQKNLAYGMIYRKPFFESGNKYDYAKTFVELFEYRSDLSYNQLFKDLFKNKHEKRKDSN